MQYSLDGKNWIQADQIRVMYQGLIVDQNDEEVAADLLVNCTHEGLILDVLNASTGGEVATRSQTAAEIADELAAI